MSQVTIKVGPKSYPIACGPGEEDKVARLGALIDQHYAKLGNARHPLEANNVVFAALFMADELAEAQSVASDARAELAEAKIALQQAQDDAINAIAKVTSEIENDKERSGGLRAEMRAEIETLRKLSSIESIVCVKDSSGGLDYFGELCQLKIVRPDWSI